MTRIVKWAVRFAECAQGRHPEQFILSLRCSWIATQDVYEGGEKISSFIYRLQETAERLHGSAPVERQVLSSCCLVAVAQLLAGL
mmetsp:Transcript_27865/g.48747  ORF Transcript_27865/g.48747 Transcript_27865/m.48747 type:complete len:85 (+) Transcript_27865:172-426(+)